MHPPLREQFATPPIMRPDLKAYTQCFNAVAKALMLDITAPNMRTSQPPPTASQAQALAHSTCSASCPCMPHAVHTGPSIRHCWLAGASHVRARCVMQGYKHTHVSAQRDITALALRAQLIWRALRERGTHRASATPLALQTPAAPYCADKARCRRALRCTGDLHEA